MKKTKSLHQYLPWISSHTEDIVTLSLHLWLSIPRGFLSWGLASRLLYILLVSLRCYMLCPGLITWTILLTNFFIFQLIHILLTVSLKYHQSSLFMLLDCCFWEQVPQLGGLVCRYFRDFRNARANRLANWDLIKTDFQVVVQQQ
jgi:hypothetical protein